MSYEPTKWFKKKITFYVAYIKMMAVVAALGTEGARGGGRDDFLRRCGWAGSMGMVVVGGRGGVPRPGGGHSRTLFYP
jgi:hypothetical protein